MREVNKVERTKKVYQLKNIEEFKSGEWLKDLPNSEFLEVSYRGNNNILIISDMKCKTVKEYVGEK
jgi:hypothetical protein